MVPLVKVEDNLVTPPALLLNANERGKVIPVKMLVEVEEITPVQVVESKYC